MYTYRKVGVDMNLQVVDYVALEFRYTDYSLTLNTDIHHFKNLNNVTHCVLTESSVFLKFNDGDVLDITNDDGLFLEFSKVIDNTYYDMVIDIIDNNEKKELFFNKLKNVYGDIDVFIFELNNYMYI